MPEQKTERLSAEELREAWWAEWRRRDFSWANLAKKRIQGWYTGNDGILTRVRPSKLARLATLQDLWREEEGRLIRGPDGRDWTAVHVPWLWEDQTPAKVGWDRYQFEAVDEAVASAIARVSENEAASAVPLKRGVAMYANASGIPLDGAIFGVMPETLEETPFLKGDRVCFMGDIDAGAEWRGIYLRSVLFEKDVTIRRLQATSSVRLASATLLGDFSIIASSAPVFTLLRPICLGALDIHGLNIQAEFSLSYGRFESTVSVDSLTASGIDFRRTDFQGDFSLSNLTGDVDLDHSTFSGVFEIDELAGATFSGQRVSVEGEASLKNIATTDLTDFENSRWSRALMVTHSSLGNADFEDAEFAGKTSFKGVEFKGSAAFARAHFQNLANFSGTRWSPDLKMLGDAFRETRFDAFVDFRGSDFTVFSAFDGANFKAEIRFNQAIAANDKIVKGVLDAATTDKQRVELEHGFRVLKQTAESARNRNLEQAFFRYELLARRHQSTTPNIEKGLSWLYGACSDYGASFVRPVVCALGLWVLFVPLYLLLGKFSGNADMQSLALIGDRFHPALPEAIGLSARSMFNLFGIWGVRLPDSAHGPLLEIATLRDSPLAALLTRCVSSIQSLLAGILLFLTALAARRRFQIN